MCLLVHSKAPIDVKGIQELACERRKVTDQTSSLRTMRFGREFAVCRRANLLARTMTKQWLSAALEHGRIVRNTSIHVRLQQCKDLTPSDVSDDHSSRRLVRMRFAGFNRFTNLARIQVYPRRS